MNGWDLYQERMAITGYKKREMVKRREFRTLENKLKESLSFFHDVRVDGKLRDVAIINSDNLNEKMIFSMPGENLRNGAYVEWMDNIWLITEKDANNEVYTRCKMEQCNYLLRWVDENKIIREQWCIVEDGTKYLTGEYEDRDFIVSRGDSRVGMTISRNCHTAKLSRKNRFLLDDPLSNRPLAFTLSKPLKIGGIYNGDGVYKWVLQEVSSSEDDNFDLMIADYYKYFPKEADDDDDGTTPGDDPGGDPGTDPGGDPGGNEDDGNTNENGRRQWL